MFTSVHTLHDSDEFAEIVVREKLAHQIFIPQVYYASHAPNESTDQVTDVVQLGERVLLVLLFQLGKDVQKIVKISVFLGVTFIQNRKINKIHFYIIEF